MLAHREIASYFESDVAKVRPPLIKKYDPKEGLKFFFYINPHIPSNQKFTHLDISAEINSVQVVSSGIRLGEDPSCPDDEPYLVTIKDSNALKINDKSNIMIVFKLYSLGKGRRNTFNGQFRCRMIGLSQKRPRNEEDVLILDDDDSDDDDPVELTQKILFLTKKLKETSEELDQTTRKLEKLIEE